jgi:hypothetical protein
MPASTQQCHSAQDPNGPKGNERIFVPIRNQNRTQTQHQTDRDAKRLNDSLICWICENAPLLVAAEPAIIAEPPLQPSNGNSHESDSIDGFVFDDFGDHLFDSRE